MRCSRRSAQTGRRTPPPGGYAFDGERFLIASGATTRKVRNIETNPRVRVLVAALATTVGIDDGWVAADGSARLVRGAEAQELNAVAVGRYLTEEGRQGYAEVFLPIMDVTIVVTPERWQSWNETGMLNTMIEHGYTEDDAARWYHPYGS
jgi:nitroimidazol reductase NimA-like FMN-containing flavoprotein (pyridoxamine 5'-phosphate oxidase superfamily)